MNVLIIHKRTPTTIIAIKMSNSAIIMFFNFDSKITPVFPAYVTQLGEILTSFTHSRSGQVNHNRMAYNNSLTGNNSR